MNTLQVFENPEFGSIRTVEIGGEPWFVLKDICEAFGEKNYRRVSSRLDDDEKGVSQISTPGGNQSMTIVNEAGLYSALFYMQPEKARNVSDKYIEGRKKQLKKFKRWVTAEVLPSIRKTGGYSVQPAAAIPLTEKTAADLLAAMQLLTEQLAARPAQEAPFPVLALPGNGDQQTFGPAARKKWMRTASEKLDLLSTKLSRPHTAILSQVYSIMEEKWNINLEEERLKVAEEKNLFSCSVLAAISYSAALRDAFQKIVDFNLAPENRGW